MNLTRHLSSSGPRWALDGHFLPSSFQLYLLLELKAKDIADILSTLITDEPAQGPLLAPIEPYHEVWAAGVTYLRSREARMQESTSANIYDSVYTAERPELFFKAIGWRVIPPGGMIRIRKDSSWNVPEPELTLVINRYAEICGYCAGNDVSSRDIEGENPLYLPQAKVYNGSCSLGPAIRLASPANMQDLLIQLCIIRNGRTAFTASTRTSQMKRGFQELVDYLYRELAFPQGAFLMTGTGIVPESGFTLFPADVIQIQAGELILENSIEDTPSVLGGIPSKP